MNQINLIGRLTKDPELRYTTNNKAVCNFDIAVNRIGQEATDFINVVVWDKQAENLEKYQSKGSLIAVSGSLRVDKYQNENGENRYKTYVLANNIEYLSTKSSETVSNEDNERLPNVEEVKKPDPFAEFGASIAIDEDEFPF